jgi:CheY-like chemotaxis protein
MSASPAQGPPAPERLRGGLLGVLRVLQQAWSGEPWTPPATPPRASAAPAALAADPIRVLVADDNPVNLMAIAAQMEWRGLVPVMATNGAEAVALACEARFDLVLMDLQMPVLDGLAATAAIRRFETTFSRPAVPVLAYSSSSPGASVLAAHGLNGSLAKPCQDDDLEDCLGRWCPGYQMVPCAPGPAGHGGEPGAVGR